LVLVTQDELNISAAFGSYFPSYHNRQHPQETPDTCRGAKYLSPEGSQTNVEACTLLQGPGT
ncbi:hypothetical protein ACXWQT_09670, partial [Streptococcus pyogenes]